MRGFKPSSSYERKMMQGVLFRRGEITAPTSQLNRQDSNNSFSSLEPSQQRTGHGGSMLQNTFQHNESSENDYGHEQQQDDD